MGASGQGAGAQEAVRLSGAESVRNGGYNVYVHFPFCRKKCAYCALYSKIGQSENARKSYFSQVIAEIRSRITAQNCDISTLYFGGGSPGMSVFAGNLTEEMRRDFGVEIGQRVKESGAEFTVEMHPSEVTEEVLAGLREMGVNRISMGVQSLDDEVLRAMGRGYTVSEAIERFSLIKKYFDNAGIDLIVGYPRGEGKGQGGRGKGREVVVGSGSGRGREGEGGREEAETGWERLREFEGLRHCSVYSLILEEKSRLGKLARDGKVEIPSDDEALDELRIVGGILGEMGLERYEISSWAQPGFECRHNLAVWSGEDYVGIGDGAYGREGLRRTRGVAADGGWKYETENVPPESDLKERNLFRMRTRWGLSPDGNWRREFPHWIPILERFAGEGLVVRTEGGGYRLTERGTEVCDTVLGELV